MNKTVAVLFVKKQIINITKMSINSKMDTYETLKSTMNEQELYI